MNANTTKATLDTNVNQFPTLTYNWLKINRTHLKGSVNAECDAEQGSLPAGVAVEKKDFSPLYESYAKAEKTSQNSVGATVHDAATLHDASLIETLVCAETGMGKPFDMQFNDAITANKIQSAVYTVKEGTIAKQPVLLHFEPQAGTATAAEQYIVAEQNTESTFILDYGAGKSDEENTVLARKASSGKDDAASNTSLFGVRTRVYAGENAIVHLVKVNLLGQSFTHFDSIGTIVADNAKVQVVQIELGAKDVFTGNYENLFGRKSSCSGEFGYVAKADHTLDINYVAHQTGKETDSKMNVRGVVMDQAAKTWRGTIDFIRRAKNATGDEQEDVLLMSPDVVNKTLPVILCDEEAVEGRHGASIGKLGADILFYMQSRGIDEKTAEALMIKSKIYAVCRFIPDKALVEKIQNYIEEIGRAHV